MSRCRCCDVQTWGRDQQGRPLCDVCAGHVAYVRCCSGYTMTGRCDCRFGMRIVRVCADRRVTA